MAEGAAIAALSMRSWSSIFTGSSVKSLTLTLSNIRFTVISSFS